MQGGAAGMSATQDCGAAVGDAWVQSLRLATMVCHEPNFNLRARASVILVGCAAAQYSTSSSTLLETASRGWWTSEVLFRLAEKEIVFARGVRAHARVAGVAVPSAVGLVVHRICYTGWDPCICQAQSKKTRRTRT